MTPKKILKNQSQKDGNHQHTTIALHWQIVIRNLMVGNSSSNISEVEYRVGDLENLARWEIVKAERWLSSYHHHPFNDWYFIAVLVIEIKSLYLWRSTMSLVRSLVWQRTFLATVIRPGDTETETRQFSHNWNMRWRTGSSFSSNYYHVFLLIINS